MGTRGPALRSFTCKTRNIVRRRERSDGLTKHQERHLARMWRQRSISQGLLSGLCTSSSVFNLLWHTLAQGKGLRQIRMSSGHTHENIRRTFSTGLDSIHLPSLQDETTETRLWIQRYLVRPVHSRGPVRNLREYLLPTLRRVFSGPSSRSRFTMLPVASLRT